VTGPDSRRRVAWIGALALLAGVLLLVALRPTILLADDYLLTALTSNGSVDWRRIWGDFLTPWLGSDWPYYRPVTTLAIGVWMSLAGLDGHSANLPCLFCHCANVALLGWLLARLRCDRSSVVLGMLILLLHPGILEAVYWLSSMTEVLHAFLVLCSIHLLVNRMRASSVPTDLLLSLSLLLCCGCKELGFFSAGAIVVAIACCRRSIANPLRLVLLVAVPLALLFVCRLLIVGFDPTAGLEGLDLGVGGLLLQVPRKIALIVVPLGLGNAWGCIVAALFFLLLGLGALRGSRLGVTLWLGVAMVGYIGASSYHFISAAYTGSRVLYSPIALFAVIVALRSDGWQRRAIGVSGDPSVYPRARTAARTGLMTAVIVLLGIGFGGRAPDFTNAEAGARRVLAGVKNAFDGRPGAGAVAILSVPEVISNVLVFCPNLFYVAAEANGCPRGRLLGLTYLTSLVYPSRKELGNIAALRAHATAGTPILAWTEAAFVDLAAQWPMTENDLAVKVRSGGTAAFDHPVSPLAIETVTFASPVAVSRADLWWQYGAGGQSATPSRFDLRHGPSFSVAMDKQLVAGLFAGGIVGLRLQADIPTDDAGPELTVHMGRSAADGPALPLSEWTVIGLGGFLDLKLPARAAGSWWAHVDCGSSGFSFPLGEQGWRVPDEYVRYLQWSLAMTELLAVSCHVYELDAAGVQLRRSEVTHVRIRGKKAGSR